MTIRTLVTRGFGNGTFNGTIALTVTRGYSIGLVLLTTLRATISIAKSLPGSVGITRAISGAVGIAKSLAGTVEIE